MKPLMETPDISRRQFSRLLAATAAFAFSGRSFAQEKTGPTMLLGTTEAFSGLDLLRVRWAAGHRPSTDAAGNALAWLLTQQDSFAQTALDQLRNSSPPSAGSRGWLPIANLSLAYDWLYDYPAFDDTLTDRICNQLLAAASAMAETPDLKHPEQASFHNYTTRFLGLTTFALCAVGKRRPHDSAVLALRSKASRAFANILEVSEIVTPEGSYHESMDYMRISYTPMALLGELQRTTTGVDPALRFGLYGAIADTYLYKLMPNGTPSREGDNEYPVLDDRDTAALGYAVHRFKNPYAAWLISQSGFAANKWAIPVLDFLWNDPAVAPRNPALSERGELPLHRYFPGVDQVVFRDRWGAEATWIEFDCGPYFAKHQHLDRGHFSIYHKGYLAIDSGADYTESESPHYINYYRRTIAHNTMLVFDPQEKFFWSENVLQVDNDGGQRMDSSRFWNTLRSRDDWDKTRDLWELAHLRVIDNVDGSYNYAFGDATRAYSSHKLRTFTRQLLYLPGMNVLLVFDRVVSTDPSFKKVWLLHGVDQPWVAGQGTAAQHGEESFGNAKQFRFQQGGGELLVHTLLPLDHDTSRRGGAGHEFWNPGDDKGGPWGSGRNWPLEPAEGGPLPTDPRELAMWKTFWGNDTKAIERSNRVNVVPGAWRVEVSPARPQLEDHFLHVLEIGDRHATGHHAVELIQGEGLTGSACAPQGQPGTTALFPTQDTALDFAEATLPSFSSGVLWIAGLIPDRHYSLELAGSNLAAVDATAPGVHAGSRSVRANGRGVIHLATPNAPLPAGVRLRLQAM